MVPACVPLSSSMRVRRTRVQSITYDERRKLASGRRVALQELRESSGILFGHAALRRRRMRSSRREPRRSGHCASVSEHILLCSSKVPSTTSGSPACCRRGNPVRVRNCPATVNGNERRHQHRARTAGKRRPVGEGMPLVPASPNTRPDRRAARRDAGSKALAGGPAGSRSPVRAVCLSSVSVRRSSFARGSEGRRCVDARLVLCNAEPFSSRVPPLAKE